MGHGKGRYHRCDDLVSFPWRPWHIHILTLNSSSYTSNNPTGPSAPLSLPGSLTSDLEVEYATLRNSVAKHLEILSPTSMTDSDVSGTNNLVKDVARTHDQYNTSNSDSVTIESADGVLFYLDVHNLKMATGAFPGSEFSTGGEPTKLTEDADVLEVVFAYTYPQRHPNLEEMEFSLLSKIAEAVEKYEVFPAMSICAVRMKEFLPRYASDILAYGVRHGYSSLINESALALSRSPLMSEFLFKLTPQTVLAWIRYSESWKWIFETAFANVEFTRRIPGRCQSIDNRGQLAPYSLCDACRVALFKWLRNIEKITSLPDLMTALTPAAHRNIPNLVYCAENGGCSNNGKCIHMEKVAKIIEDGIASIPPFEQYLYQPMVSE